MRASQRPAIFDGGARFEIVLTGHDQFQAQRAFGAPAEHGERAMGRNLVQRLGELEVVAELRAGLFLALDHAGLHQAAVPGERAQFADQIGVFRDAFHEDLARAVERGGGVGETRLGIEILRGGRVRIERRIGEQRVEQRFDAGFARDLRLGAALLLVGRVQVFEPGLGVGAQNGLLQFRRQLALFIDTLQHAGTALLQFAQIAQTLLQVAQLRVVQAAGDFLAVAGDERHGGAFVEQGDGGLHLLGADGQFLGDALDQIGHGILGLCLMRAK